MDIDKKVKKAKIISEKLIKLERSAKCKFTKKSINW